MDYKKYNIQLEEVTDSKIIASSHNFQIELVEKIGKNDVADLIETSKSLIDVFGEESILTERNINKYFSDKTLPFIARYNNIIIGYIIGVPLENFKDESWAHFDKNLLKKNTLYTYAFVFKKTFRGRKGYAKTLKRIYISWAKRQGYRYITGHVKKGISEKFKNTEIVKTFRIWYQSNSPFNYYRREL